MPPVRAEGLELLGGARAIARGGTGLVARPTQTAGLLRRGALPSLHLYSCLAQLHCEASGNVSGFIREARATPAGESGQPARHGVAATTGPSCASPPSSSGSSPAPSAPSASFTATHASCTAPPRALEQSRGQHWRRQLTTARERAARRRVGVGAGVAHQPAVPPRAAHALCGHVR